MSSYSLPVRFIVCYLFLYQLLLIPILFIQSCPPLRQAPTAYCFIQEEEEEDEDKREMQLK